MDEKLENYVSYLEGKIAAAELQLSRLQARIKSYKSKLCFPEKSFRETQKGKEYYQKLKSRKVKSVEEVDAAVINVKPEEKSFFDEFFGAD